MNTRVGRLTALLLFVLALGSCNRDEVTGVSAVSADRASLPSTLRNAILFTTDEFAPRLGSQLAVMEPDGSARHRVTDDDHGYLNPALSPDGRRIAVSRFTGDAFDGIYLMKADGSEPSLLVNRSSEFGTFFFDFQPTWSPDGGQIAFVSWVLEDGFGPNARIFVINVDGTGLRQLTPSVGPGEFAFDEGPSWSPDGTRIVFTRTFVLHVINADGTGLTPLPNEDFAVSPSWSPDGQRIAYQSFDVGIRIRNADGTSPATVTSTPGGWPRWSPDGRRLVFVSTISGRNQIYVINVDGTGETRLSFTASDNQPAWSPFPRGTSGAGAAVEIAPTDAKLAPDDTRQLTATVRTAGGEVLSHAPVTWSSSDPAVATVTSAGLVTAVENGVAQIRAVFGGDTARANVRVADRILRNAIVYSTDEFGVAEFAVVKPDGSGRRRLTTDQIGYISPDISPDGRRIVFSGPFHISLFVIDVDDIGLTEEGREVFFDFDQLPDSPVWSPDASRIAFTGTRQGPFGSSRRILVINADGTDVHQVSPDDTDATLTTSDDSPTWSPDGTRLIFTRNGVLHVINADGAGLSPLPNDDLASSPDWSPDGTRVAYASPTPGFGIRIRDADGSNPVTVTTQAGDSHPRWAPDNQRLVFVRVVDGRSQLFVINANGSGEARLSIGPGQHTSPSWSPLP